MSLTPVSENDILIDEKSMDIRVTKFSVSDPEPTLPKSKDDSYPLQKLLNDLSSKCKENLHKICREGDAATLELYVRQNKSRATKLINELNSENLSPLHYAARYNHLNCVKILVDKAKANVNTCNQDKITPLHFATRYKRKSSMANLEDNSAQNFESKPSAEWLNKRNTTEEKRNQILEEENRPTRDNSVILYLISHGANPNAQDVYGCTPLHYAAMRGNEVATKQLLMLTEVFTEIEDNESMTPLHLACAHNHEKIADMLVRRGANMFNNEESGQIPFHIVCTEGNMNLVKLFIELAEERKVLTKLLNDEDNERSTPLHCAVENGHVDVAKFLLQKGSKPSAMKQDGETPLHMASHYGSVELVKLLISAGADLNAQDYSDQTPLHEAAKKNHVSFIKYLFAQGADIESRDHDSYTPLLIAASYGHRETIEELLNLNCDVFVTDKENKSSLYVAVEYNYPEAVRALLKNPDNHELLQIPDFNSNYPLHIAAKLGKVELVEALLEHDANESIKNEEEQTPLHVASQYGKVDVVKLLLQRSGESLIADEDEDSNTPLHLAAENGYSKVIKILLDAGADIDARNCNRWTALDSAAARGQFRAAQVLLENDSPVDPMDKSKVTPLYLACKNGHDKIVRLLLKNNACINTRIVGDEGEDGSNPLDAAIDNGNRDCVLAILEHKHWQLAMRNQTQSETGRLNTPMRKLIRKMPDIAEIVFNKCCETNKKHYKNKDLSVTYTFEFLEDTYASWGMNDKVIYESQTVSGEDDESESGKTIKTFQTYDDNGNLHEEAQKYSTDTKLLMKNHPLMIMVKSEREDLLAHPLVTNLLKIKWNRFGQLVYYTNLTLYLIFIIAFLTYLFTALPPHAYYFKNNSIGLNNGSICLLVESILPNEKLALPAQICKYIILILSVFGIIKEIAQLVMKGKRYFGFENIMEWSIYILAFISVFDMSSCQIRIGIRESWQWQTGTVAVFIGIVNLVLFIRKVPFFGIFVVMFLDVMWTFLKFLPLFLLFIFAFAVAFFLLLSNQIPFSSILHSMLKTAVMTIGEFEYDTILNSQYESSPANNQLVIYDGVTYAIFVVFIIVMSIITMNLLVGLAVDDIKAVQEKATLKRLAMQVQLALDVEGLVPERFRRNFVKRTITIYPNQVDCCKKLIRMTEPEDLSNYIPVGDDNLDELERIEANQRQTSDQMIKLKQKMKELQEQNSNVVEMIQKIMRQLKIQVDEEEFEINEEDI